MKFFLIWEKLDFVLPLSFFLCLPVNCFFLKLRIEEACADVAGKRRGWSYNCDHPLCRALSGVGISPTSILGEDN